MYTRQGHTKHSNKHGFLFQEKLLTILQTSLYSVHVAFLFFCIDFQMRFPGQRVQINQGI